MSSRPLGVIASLLLVGCATAGAGRIAGPTKVPEAIQVPRAVLVSANAVGVQIYECRPKKDDPATFEWAFKAPEAELVDATGTRLGRHYQGPTWEWADGSKVVGTVKTKVDAPTAGAIAWLLLEAKSTEGNGVLAGVAAIQRVNTEGGLAPTSGCTASDAGTERRVPYRATYHFYSVD